LYRAANTALVMGPGLSVDVGVPVRSPGIRRYAWTSRHEPRSPAARQESRFVAARRTTRLAKTGWDRRRQPSICPRSM
jgi:hypothetical protein